MEIKGISAVALFLTLVGTILNAQQKITGFYVWVVANLLWLGITWKFNDLSLTSQYVVFTVLNFYGIWQWRKNKLGG